MVEKEIEQFISDWNRNNSKLSSNSFFSTKTPIHLIRFCLNIHKNINLKSLLIDLNQNLKRYKKEVLDFDKFKSALEYVYHFENVNEKNEKYVFEGDKHKSFETIIERKIEYVDNDIIITKIDQNYINSSIIKEFKTPLYYRGKDSLNFIFFQCHLYNYDLDIIKDLVKKYEAQEHSDSKFIFLKNLPIFFNTFFSFNTEIEKFEYWIKTFFKNEDFKFFEEYLNINTEKYSEETIQIFKKLHHNKILKTHNLHLNKSIDSNSFIEKEIKKFKSKLETKSQYGSWSFHEQKPSYYDTYHELVVGNREYFDNIDKRNRAGEVEAIVNFIEFLEGQQIKQKKKEVLHNKVSKNLLPIEIFENTRDYLKKT